MRISRDKDARRPFIIRTVVAMIVIYLAAAAAATYLYAQEYADRAADDVERYMENIMEDLKCCRTVSKESAEYREGLNVAQASAVMRYYRFMNQAAPQNISQDMEIALYRLIKDEAGNVTGFEEAISTAENGFEVIERKDTNGEFEIAMEVTKEILEQHPDINIIMCGNDQIAVGAKTAVNVLNMNDVIIYGVDGSPDIKKELKKSDNQIAGTAAQSPINIGKVSAQIGIDMLLGEDYEKETYEDVFMINEDNVDMYGVDGWQ